MAFRQVWGTKYISCILLLSVISLNLYKANAGGSTVCNLKILSGFIGDNPLLVNGLEQRKRQRKTVFLLYSVIKNCIMEENLW